MTIGLETMPYLTPEQRALASSVRGTTQRAADELLRTHGPILPFDNLIALGNLGIVIAAHTFDGSRGIPFSHWALCRALCSMLDGAPVDHKPDGVAAAMRAAMLFLSRELHADLSPIDSDHPLEDEAACQAIEDAIIVAMVEAARPRDANVESWSKPCAAIDRAAKALRPEQRKILELLRAGEYDLRSVTRGRNLDYWTLLEDYRAIIRAIRSEIAAPSPVA
jgi:hypothetical protein